MPVKTLEWVEGSTSIRWELDNGAYVRKEYHFPVGSACMLIDRTGVAVVEPYEEVGVRNGVIFNEDGSERFRLHLPAPELESYGFYYMYYEATKLKAVIATRLRDVAVTVNPETGECFDLHETR